MKRAYIRSYIALLLLTAATTAVAFIDLGPVNTLLAIAIAGLKALIIALFFMHLIASPNLVRVIAIAALIWVAILMALTAGDFVTRGWLPVPGK
jgi:cytochrome c oxidase subunit 4